MILWNNSGKLDAASRKRQEMVRQVAERGVKNEAVLNAMLKIPRELFVPEAMRHEAYCDYPLPIGEKQTISQPTIVGLMTELLEIDGNSRVLEVGTGSGYQTAILAEIAANVFSVERIANLLINARKTLESINTHNVAMTVADGTKGWSEYAPYDAIIVTAGGPSIPDVYMEQLKVGGRLVIPVGEEQKQTLFKIVKTATGKIEKKIGDCSFVKLVGQNGWG